MSYDQALNAIADPTRRVLLEKLRTGPSAVGQLADGLDISRPAVSQHLRVLSDAGLLSVRSEGTRRLYSIRPEGLADIRAWLDTLWDDALTAFAAAAAREAEKQEDVKDD